MPHRQTSDSNFQLSALWQKKYRTNKEKRWRRARRGQGDEYKGQKTS